MKIIYALPLMLLANFSFSQNLWEPRGQEFSSQINHEYLGSSSAITPDGNTIVIASEGASGNENYMGKTDVYTWANGTWQQKGNSIFGEDGNDYSGNSVDISDDGNTIIIGAQLNDGNAANGTAPGHIRVYSWSGTAWVQKGTDINGQALGDYFGTCVSISGDGSIIAAGADRNDAAGTDAGHVRIFQWNGTGWVQMGTTINGEAAGNYCGSAISLSESGNEIAVGAWGNNGNNSGHVRVFQWNGSAWVMKGTEMNGEGADDFFGDAVSLSSDGNKLAVGAKGNDGGGNNSGHVRVFEWNGTSWLQKGTDINGLGPDMLSGSSVSLVRNGNTIGIWSRFNDATDYYGRIRVLDWNGITWEQRGNEIDFGAFTVATIYSVHVRLTEDGNTLIGSNPAAKINDIMGGKARVYSCNRYTAIEAGTCDSLVSPSGNYTWYATGNYSDTLIADNGYDSIISVNLSINSFTADVIQNMGELTTSIANGTYQWFNCTTNQPIAGAASSTFTIPANGNYAVIVTKNGCTDTSACYVVDDLGLGEFPTTISAIYPNPNNGDFEIVLGLNAALQVTDSKGTVVFERELPAGKHQVSLTGLAKGMYFINTRSGDQVQAAKLIIR